MQPKSAKKKHAKRPSAAPGRFVEPAGLMRRLGQRLLGGALGTLLGRLTRIYAALWLGAGGLVLGIAWQAGPQQLLQSWHFAKLSARAEARIVESWLALDVALADMGDNPRWRAFTKAAPCVVVEYDGREWGEALRRAFCGNRFLFSEAYTLQDLREIAPRVPFAWSRDASGFAQPELRMSERALDWLARAPAGETVLMGPPPKNALELLRRELERPVDHAIAGWAEPAPRFALVVDPANPSDAMPADFVAERLESGPNWVVFALFGWLGLLAWSGGMRLLLGDIGKPALAIATVLPLLGLPWWSDSLPRGLRALHRDVGGMIGDMLDSIDPLGRLVASEPQAALLVNGARLTLPAGAGLYADTFGRLRFTRPDPPPSSPDAALAALAESVRVQVAALSPDERVALFSRLATDKADDLKQAGLVFLPAAREALIDPQSAAAVRQSARGFLSDWVTQPVLEPHPSHAAFAERVRLYRELVELPVPVIANPARWIVERAEQAQTARR